MTDVRTRARTAAGALQGAEQFPINRAAPISNKALTANVATITTALAHGLATGEVVSITGVGAPFDSADPSVDTITVTGATTFTYPRTNADVASAAATGAVNADLRATATQIRTFANPTVVRKAADEALPVSTTTLQNDDELFLTPPVNATYRLKGFIIFDAATAADMRSAFTVPTGATILWGAAGGTTTVALGGAGSGNWSLVAAATVQTWGGAGVGTKLGLHIEGLITMGATAGNVQFQWAQSVSDATVVTVFAGSWLSYQPWP